ncbi:uncharacterized protein LOC124142827 isoform X2 [Haliotis rufescens]|uniref:uncharacterized protein LOC124142827 isoform X2 n=1 Tax=Haliotis rufescens TaxID=6454 RepID=UPI00201F5AF6|nr:uncharacterized protein LOC124142827 isoform X2 [Haliotis rufescens]
MGVTIETWRARIGLHSQPNKSPRTTTTQGMVTGGGSFPCRPRHVLLVIGLLLLLSGNVELNPGPPSRRQQPPQQNTSSKLYTNKEESFTTTEVLEILQNPDLNRVINQPPVKPRAGQAFLYHFTDANKRDDWRCDQYHFHHDATREQPKADPKFKKLFFVIKTRVGKDKRFKKHAYILLGEDNNLVLFQYIGNERIAEDLPHGNSKNTSVPYTRLCPSVIRAIKDGSSNETETLRCLNQQASSSTVPEVYKPRSRLHVMNTRYRGQRDCTKEARTNRLGITGDKTTYNLTAFLTKDIEVGKVFPRKGKRKQPKSLKNLQQISCKQIVRAPLGCLPYDKRVHGSQDDLKPQEGTRNKNTTPQTPLGFDLVHSNDDSSAADNDNKPSLESETSQASKHYHLTSDESNALQMASRDNTDLGASEAVDFLKNILEDQCITSKNSITVDAPSQHFEENNLTHSLSEVGDFQVSCQDNNQSNSDIAERNSGDTTLTQTAPDPVIENVNNEETQLAPLEKFIHVIFNNGQLGQMIKLLQHLHSTWNVRQQQHKAAEDQAVDSVALADEQTCFNDNGLRPRMLSSSLPFTASTLITQVRSLWMSDFKTTRDCLVKTETVCSIGQQNTNSDTLLSLLTSLVVGAFNMQTDIVEFVETLKERPGNLEPPGNNIIADVSSHVRYRIGSYTVSGQDAMKLNKTSWLDDSVIHAYLSLLEKRFSKEDKKVFIFECFLATFWEKKNYEEWLYKEVPLMEYTWILMPICRHSHWILLAANIREGGVCVINSKPSDVTQRDILHHWSEYMTHRSRETRENLSDWREIQCPIFPQTDGSSCGVFILMAAEALLSGVSPCVMRNCHVTRYREYVKQQIINAAEMQAGDIEESNVQSSNEVEIIESSSSTNQNTRKLHAETENRRKSISTGTSVIDSQEESVICEELVDGISDMKMEPSTVKKQERLDTSGGMTEDTNFIVRDSIHTIGSMEIEATSEITPSDLHDTTPGACPADLRSYCEELFQNQKSSFVALTLVCLMKGHLQLTTLECHEHSSPLKDYIKWGCQLCHCGEPTNAQIRNAFLRLEKLVLISNMNTCVTLRNSEIQKTISTVIADHLQEYIDIIDLKFIYHYLRIHTQDGGFHVWLKGKMVKDLARRFAKEVLLNNLALVLSHDSCGYFHFNVMLRKAVQHLLKSDDFHSILENTDKTFGGTFIHWMCFGRNAELFKSLSFWLTDSQKAGCLVPCCISGNSSIVQLLCSETELIECQKIPKLPQLLPGITHKKEKTLTIIESYDTHALPPLHLSSLYGHTGVVSYLLESGFDVNEQLVHGSGNSIPFQTGSTAALVAATMGNIDIVKCLIQHSADLNLHDILFNAPIHSACRSGNHDLVALISRQCCISEGDAEGDTPLHIACERGDVDIVSMLLERGADCTMLNYTNEMPLDIVCKKGFLEVAKVILNHRSYPLPYDGSNTPLHKACIGGFTDIIELLLEYDADRSVTVDDQHPLLIAAYSNNIGVVQMLLHMNAARAVLCDTHIAVMCLRKGHNVMAKLLLEKGASVSGTDMSEYSALDTACEKGDIEIVKLLLEKGASVSDSDIDEYSALAKACGRGDIEIVKLLLEKGASVSGTDMDEYSALAIACGRGDIEIVKLLLEKGASVSGTDMDEYSALAIACEKGDTEIVKLLLEKRAIMSGTDMDGYSALATACERGDIEIVKLLLEKGASVSDSEMDGYSPLATACKRGEVEIVKLLLEKGASVSDSDMEGYSPLACACRRGDIEIVKLLLEKGASVSDSDRQGHSPLAIACKKGDLEIVKLLLEKGASVSDSDMYGYSALALACKRGEVEIVKLLLEKGASVSDSDMEGYSPLACACRRGDIEIVKLLLEKGASVSDSDRQGHSPLAIACKKGDLEIVKLLLEKGASVSDSDMYGYSALALACERGDIEIVKLLLEKGASVSGTDLLRYSPLAGACRRGDIEIVKLLLEKGASVSDSDRQGHSPLAIACKKGDLEIVKLLLEKGASVSARETTGFSVLVIACEQGSKEIVKMLLEKGASVTDNDRDRYGHPPLAKACERGNMAIVKLLMEKGASVSGTDRQVHSPLALACKKGDLEIVKLLLEKGASVSGTDRQVHSPLALACKKGDLEIVKLLLEKGASVSARETTGFSVLVIACEQGSKEIVKLLLEKGASVTENDRDRYGHSPLALACERGNVAIVKLLLEKGASVSDTDRQGYSPLALACKKGDIEIVKLLLEKEASVSGTNMDEYSALATACEKGDIEIVKLLLEKGVCVSGSDMDGYSELAIACRRGDIEIVKLLLEKGAREPSAYRNFRLLIKRLQNLASIIDIQSLLKWVLTKKYFAIFRMLWTILPPDATLEFFLREACHQNSPQTLLLLTKICDEICLQNTLITTESLKNIKCIEILKLLNTEVEGGDLLHIVVACGNINLVRSYFDNFPFSDHADACVIIASRYGHTAIIEYLLHKCNNNINSNTYSGRCNVQNTRRLFHNLSTSIETKYRKVRTALYEACCQGHIDIVRLLLQYDMYRTDQAVYSSLHLVCRRGNIDMLQLLLDSEAYVDHVDKNGNTGLYICTENGRVLAMQLLLEKGANPSHANNEGKAPFHAAIGNNNFKAIALLLRYTTKLSNVPVSKLNNSEQFKFVSDHIPLPTLTSADPDGNSLLHYAVRYGFPDNVATLLERGVDGSLANCKKETAMHIAAERGCQRSVRLLIQYHYTSDVENVDKQTPLHCAASEGHLNIVKDLIECNSNISLKGCLHYAAKSGHTETVQHLVNKGAVTNETDCQSDTPLHPACESGNIKTVEALLLSSADVNAVGHKGRTPLHIACARGYDRIVNYLLDHGADPNMKNKFNNTPLLSAVVEGHLDVIKLMMLKGAKSQIAGANGSNYLIACCMRGHKDVVRYLIENGADISSKDIQCISPLSVSLSDIVQEERENIDCILKTGRSGIEGMTSLHAAMDGNHFDLAEYLINQGADVLEDDQYGKSILLKVCEKGNSKVTKAFLSSESVFPSMLKKHIKKGFSMKNIPASHHSEKNSKDSLSVREIGNDVIEVIDEPDTEFVPVPPVKAACDCDHDDVASVIIAYSAGWLSDMDDSHLYESISPLHLAYDAGFMDIVACLLSSSTNSNAIDSHGYTIFHKACEHGDVKVCKIILKLKRNDGNPEVCMKTKYGEMFCHIASRKGYMHILKMCLKVGMDVTHVTEEGDNVLHLACSYDKHRVCAFLLDTSPSLAWIKNHNGFTPLDIVMRRGNNKIARIFFTHAKLTQYGRMQDVIWMYLRESMDNINRLNLLVRCSNVMDLTVDHGNTPFHVASMVGSNRATDYLLKHDKKDCVKLKNRNGDTPLHIASEQGHSAVVRSLLTQCHVNAINNYNETALYLSSLNADLDTVVALLAAGACVDSRNFQGDSPLHFLLYGCANKQNNDFTHIITILRHCLKSGAGPSQNDLGNTPLHVACCTGKIVIVGELLSGYKDLCMRNTFGKTPLHVACERGHSVIVDLLLEVMWLRRSFGEEFNDCMNHQDVVNGSTPLHLASRCSGQAALLLVEHGANTTIKDNDGNTPIWVAYLTGQKKNVKHLLPHTLCLHINGSGDTLLHAACRSDQTDMFQIIIDWLGSVGPKIAGNTVNASNCTRQTSLHLASANGNSYFVEQLLLMGAMPNNSDTSRKTALHYACIGRFLLVVAHLLKHGAYVNVCDDFIRTSLHYACESGSLDIAEMLTKAGGDPYIRDKDGRTPLDLCSHQHRAIIMKSLRFKRKRQSTCSGDPQYSSKRARCDDTYRRGCTFEVTETSQHTRSVSHFRHSLSVGETPRRVSLNLCLQKE